jgi:hypothetical protein
MAVQKALRRVEKMEMKMAEQWEDTLVELTASWSVSQMAECWADN